METIFTDRLIVETGCMLYMRIISTNDDMTIYAFKHDEFRCEMEIFSGLEYKYKLEEWLILPIDTAMSY